jgi:hypothetical protein
MDNYGMYSYRFSTEEYQKISSSTDLTDSAIMQSWYGKAWSPSTIAISTDSLHTFTWRYDTVHASGHYFDDGVELKFPRPFKTLYHESFSPNGQLLALSVMPEPDSNLELQWPRGDTLFPQVWIYNVEDPSSPSLQVINYQCSFCKYTGGGGWAEFLTDSTLAVSMYSDSDMESPNWISPLWEITIDGQVARKLTFLPESVVKSNSNSEFSLQVYPNPAGNELQIFGGQPGTVRLFDMLGTEVLTRYSNSSEVTLDISRLPQGTYFLRSGSASAKVIIAR